MQLSVMSSLVILFNFKTTFATKYKLYFVSATTNHRLVQFNYQTIDVSLQWTSTIFYIYYWLANRESQGYPYHIVCFFSFHLFVNKNKQLKLMKLITSSILLKSFLCCSHEMIFGKISQWYWTVLNFKL